MRSTFLATIAAALLGWGFVVDQSLAGSPSSGGASPTTPGGTSGITVGQISNDQLKAYIQARQEIRKKDPGLSESTMASGDLSDRRDRLEAVLSGSVMKAEEFLRVHRQVQSDPALRARVEAQLGVAGRTGASGTGRTAKPASGLGSGTPEETGPGGR